MPVDKGQPKTIMGYILKDLNRSYIVWNIDGYIILGSLTG